MLKVSTLNFKTGVARVKSEWLPDSVENSDCRVNDLKCIQLHVLDVTYFCSRCSRDKNLRDLNQGQVCLVLSIVPETRCSRIAELQEENMV
jgi:hypothetical protein